MRGFNQIEPNTVFSAPDILQYIGSIFVLWGTVVLGVITLLLSKKANFINERLFSLEERARLPLLRIEKLLADNDRFQLMRFVLSIMISQVQKQKSPFFYYALKFKTSANRIFPILRHYIYG